MYENDTVRWVHEQVEGGLMGDGRATVLLHPVRLRILQAALGRQVTTAMLAAALPDVPAASLYRHISALIDGGVLEVVAERAVRGAHERTLQVALPAASLGAEDIADLTIEQHRDSVTAFLAGVLQAATDYLTAPGSDPAHDGFGYRQVALWADDEELAALTAALREVLSAAAERGPREGRRRRVLTTVLLPDPDANHS
jgi:DNA-binding transcriptional ArsR family regulator